MNDLIVQLGSKSFRGALEQKLVLVDFWEPWCGPCQIQLPVLEEVARRVAGRAIVAQVNVDEAQKLAAHFGIQSLPTLVLFKNGEVVRQFLGSQSAAALTAAIEDTAKCPPVTRQPSNAYARTVERNVRLTTREPRPPTTSSTLYAHLLQGRRGPAKPLDVLVVDDGIRARRWVQGLLLRIRGHLGAGLRLACTYQRIDEFPRYQGMIKSPRIELVFVVASCCATLPQEALNGVTALLPLLKANQGAVAFLSGTRVPRQLDVLLVERFLRTQVERAGVAYFSGSMPGLGCPGCCPPKREKPGPSGAKHLCVLHARRDVRASTHPGASGKPKPAKAKVPAVAPTKPGNPAHATPQRRFQHESSGQRVR